MVEVVHTGETPQRSLDVSFKERFENIGFPTRFSVEIIMNDWEGNNHRKKTAYEKIGGFFSIHADEIERRSNGNFNPNYLKWGLYDLSYIGRGQTTSSIHVLWDGRLMALATEMKVGNEIKYTLFSEHFHENLNSQGIKEDYLDTVRKDLEKDTKSSFTPDKFSLENYILTSYKEGDEKGRISVVCYDDNLIETATQFEGGTFRFRNFNGVNS